MSTGTPGKIYMRAPVEFVDFGLFLP